ncbi:enolase 4 isoform X1 [Nothobranchius furzeri]
MSSNPCLREHEERYQNRKEAVEFYRLNGVKETLEAALNEMFLLRPGDVNGYLAEYFLKLSTPPRISRLRGRKVYDARGQPSIQADVFCTICNLEKSTSSASVSSCLPPEGMSLYQDRTHHVTTAAQWINEHLSDELKDQDPCDQSEVDRRLSNFFKARLQEDKDIQEMEKQRSLTSTKQEVEPPAPPSAKTRDKRSTGKLLPPAEPLEPVLPGSMAIGAVSLAVAKTGAQVKNIPLYKHVAYLRNHEAPGQFHIPVLLVTLLSCGKTSPGKLCLLEEVILIPKMGQQVKQIIGMTLELQEEMRRIMSGSTKAGAASSLWCDSGAPAVGYNQPEEPLDLITDACRNLGVELGTDVYLALNCAAPGLLDYAKGKYEVCTGVLKSPDELVDLYQSLISRYPAVVALIDPFRREDTKQWEQLSRVLGDSCSLLSDITQNPQAPPLPGARGYVLKQVNETTVSDMVHITSDHRGLVLMGAAYGEPCSDASFSDIAVGLGLEYVKLGGLSGAERMAKYNRLVSIEEELAQQGDLVYKESHPPPLFPEKGREPSTAE